MSFRWLLFPQFVVFTLMNQDDFATLPIEARKGKPPHTSTWVHDGEGETIQPVDAPPRGEILRFYNYFVCSAMRIPPPYFPNEETAPPPPPAESLQVRKLLSRYPQMFAKPPALYFPLWPQAAQSFFVAVHLGNVKPSFLSSRFRLGRFKPIKGWGYA